MATILELMSSQPERALPADATLIEEGKHVEILYILIEGLVEIVKGDVQITTVAEPGSVFGEIAVLLDTPHMASVRTLAPSRFLVIDDPRDFFATRPELTLHVARLLARRLGLVTSYLVDLKHQFAEQENHLGMVDEVLESLLHHQPED